MLRSVDSSDASEILPTFDLGRPSLSIGMREPEDLILAQTGHKKRDTHDKYIRRTNKLQENAAMRLGL